MKYIIKFKTTKNLPLGYVQEIAEEIADTYSDELELEVVRLPLKKKKSNQVKNTLDRIEKAYEDNGSEELLFGDFIDIRRELEESL